MSTLRPDQLPTPTAAPAAQPAVLPLAAEWGAAPMPVAPSPAVPTQVSPAGAPGTATNPVASAARRYLVRKAAAAGLAVAIVAVAGAAMTLRGSGAEAADRDRDTQVGDRDERDDRDDDPATSEGGWLDEPADDPSDDPSDDPGVPAGNASIDVAAAYAAVIGFAPSADTVDCVSEAMQPVIADVQAVVDGTATTYAQVQSAMTPFAECAPAADFDAAVIAGAAQVMQGLQLDQMCAQSVVDTFTLADRVGILTDAYADPQNFVQKLSNTFGGCAF
ncbi:MAG: hypothetical protein KDB40_05675 [Acidimicrobiales bacterium]|nr:hypothetical protein [Acidimicrobiales bacterium]MCB9392180.1 hypothetical protein [Acidimicrobiaceae bacterium]